MDVLERIIERKRTEVTYQKKAVSQRELEQQPLFSRQPLSARKAILQPGSSGIISEFKRKSPSKGIINDQVSVAETTAGYVGAGAACLSVLTDEHFFGGTSNDLMQARQANPSTPIIRKDFIIDPYQIVEAKAIGADFILLIAACLTPQQVVDYSQLAHELGLEVLLEVHDEEELANHLTDTVDLVGVNNRNLKTFVTDIQTSVRLSSLIPESFVKISESGLQEAQSIVALRQAGYQGFLIGETFMKTSDPASALQQLIDEVHQLHPLPQKQYIV
ncbi:indole-3-glycerol phosphate synthase [Larkinella arboricola]|uniref:Indole-3-glycerol phosphate synthase n=1 Tax=Larkinella arboricola TaxID=643671 RepID=A0A327WGD0_LARAB|nr:indole-3-glycerol phosphate synthase TrpC [Larkinella arboricola]RAJ89765.1 indole-3-glycerol phosphate synthase [Larkinella arboricola]